MCWAAPLVALLDYKVAYNDMSSDYSEFVWTRNLLFETSLIIFFTGKQPLRIKNKKSQNVIFHVDHCSTNTGNSA
jgi:hypothetical protein